MSVEKRVKPSTRMMDALRRRRRKIFIIGGGSLLIILAVVVTTVLYQRHKVQSEQNLEFTATRVLLSSKTTYEGEWIQSKDNYFEVYLPAGSTDDTRTYNSEAVRVERDTDYDNSMTRAFGVLTSEETFDFQIEDDMFLVLDSVRDKLIEDIESTCWGHNASGGFDVDIVDFSNGQKAMKITGDIEMQNAVKPTTDSEEITTETTTRPMIAYITLQRGHAVTLWASWNPDDAIAVSEVPNQLNECLATLWQNKDESNMHNWVPVATTVDENGYTVFLDAPHTPDGDSKSEPADDSDIAMIVDPGDDINQDAENPTSEGQTETEEGSQETTE